jgi:hypothetical protein
MLRAAAMAGIIALATGAHAEPAKDTYRLGWTRGARADACPSERELAQLVTARLQRDPFADSAERAIEGTAFRTDRHWHSELVIRDANGAQLGRRELSAESDDCRALTAAVTLAIVLTIDPNASLDQPPEAAIGSFPADPPSSPAGVVPPPEVAKPPSRATAPAPCPTCAAPARGPSVSALVVGSVGTLPAPTVGAELLARVPLGALDALVGLRALPPVDTDDGHIAIGIVSGSLGLCGGTTWGNPRVAWCGQAEAGAITAMARDLPPVDAGSYPWLALSTGPRLIWPAQARFGLEVGAAAIMPLTRQRFRVSSPEPPEFQAGSVGGLLFLGVHAGP